mmetsp:Transcript_5080/g.11255  ORF Transcript_5080/g.11255 Transcript_5080/m.11255 type:complete len:300 (+) Transcript_5080:50-949(+)
MARQPGPPLRCTQPGTTHTHGAKVSLHPPKLISMTTSLMQYDVRSPPQPLRRGQHIRHMHAQRTRHTTTTATTTTHATCPCRTTPRVHSKHWWWRACPIPHIVCDLIEVCLVKLVLVDEHLCARVRVVAVVVSDLVLDHPTTHAIHLDRKHVVVAHTIDRTATRRPRDLTDLDPIAGHDRPLRRQHHDPPLPHGLEHLHLPLLLALEVGTVRPVRLVVGGHVLARLRLGPRLLDLCHERGLRLGWCGLQRIFGKDTHHAILTRGGKVTVGQGGGAPHRAGVGDGLGEAVARPHTGCLVL